MPIAYPHAWVINIRNVSRHCLGIKTILGREVWLYRRAFGHKEGKVGSSVYSTY